MAGLIAPINMPVPKAPSQASDWIAPEEPGQTSIGPNIDWAKVPSNLLNTIALMDPSGMMGGPAGLVWGKSANPKWMEMLSKYQKLGSAVEKEFPRIGAATKETPVKLYEKLSSSPQRMAEYLSSSPGRPQGTINLYGPRDQWTTVHEMAHRLYEADPMARSLGYDMMQAAPVGTESALLAHGVTDLKSKTPEYFAYALEDLLKTQPNMPGNKFADMIVSISDIKAPPEMKGKILDFLKSVPGDKQKETLEAITGVFGKSELTDARAGFNDLIRKMSDQDLKNWFTRKNKYSMASKEADAVVEDELKKRGFLDFLKSERGSFSNKPIGRAAVKAQKDAEKSKEIMDVYQQELHKYIPSPMSGGSRKGGGMIVNKPGKLSEYLEETPRPTSYDPKTGARKWEF